MNCRLRLGISGTCQETSPSHWHAGLLRATSADPRPELRRRGCLGLRSGHLGWDLSPESSSPFQAGGSSLRFSFRGL
eukprot:8542251-Alexandrium_andersonii.AAC.1